MTRSFVARMVLRTIGEPIDVAGDALSRAVSRACWWYTSGMVGGDESRREAWRRGVADLHEETCSSPRWPR